MWYLSLQSVPLVSNRVSRPRHPTHGRRTRAKTPLTTNGALTPDPPYDGSANPIGSATLTIVADDVDAPSDTTDGEQDEVYFNGHYLGLLDALSVWTNYGYDPGPGNVNQPVTTTVFALDPAWIAPNMPTEVRIESLWGCEVETSTLEVNSGQIPEPMTMLAVGMGIAGLGGYIRKRRRA